ncbi:MAG: tetratricopeptide repeat protein [Pseudomonadota bacterium]
MKKNKKHVSPECRFPQSKQTNTASDSPPKNFIKELVNLFKNKEMGLLAQKADEAIRRWPGHTLGWKVLADIMLMQGKFPHALAPLSHLVTMDPDDVQAHSHLGIVLFEIGRLVDSEESYRKALALKPDFAEAHNNLGNVLKKQGRIGEAEERYRTALVLKPDFAEAHNNLGNALKEQGRIGEAEESYRKALVLKPDFAEAHNNLGNILKDSGQLVDAEASYRYALTLKEDYVEALANLGNTLLKLDRLKKAEAIYRQALEKEPDNASVHSGLGDVLLKLGRSGDAIARYRQGIELAPADIKARSWLNHVLSQMVPLWHVPMMNDRLRNDAYYEALRSAITTDSHVLEIGTGSGLLAMMAAKFGARNVTTCEAVSEIAAIARDIVAKNGFASSVKVISKMSTKMEIGVDMEDRADLLVSEILSSEFLGEGVLSSIEDAKRRLLKPQARIIPAGGTIQFALFAGADIERNIRVDGYEGFDLTKFNEIVAQKQYVSRADLNIELLTDDTSSFFFDFQHTDLFPKNERKIIEVPVRKPGRCCGIIQWIRLDMGDSIVFENHPLMKNTATSWQHCAYVFRTPLEILPGQTAVISAVHNGETPWFFFEGMK